MNKYITEYLNQEGLLFPGPEIIAPSEDDAQKIAEGTGLNKIKVVGRLVQVIQWGQRIDCSAKPHKGGGSR